MHRPILLLLTALAAFTASPLSAQNLVVNGDFDSDVAGWSTSSGDNVIFQWNAADADGEPDSGSILIGNVHPNANNGVVVQQCFRVVAGQDYQYGGKVRMPTGPGQSLVNPARFSLHWKTDPDCAVNNGGAVTLGAALNAFDTWFTRGPSTVTARDGSQSVLIRMLVTKVEAGGSAFAQFDDVYLIPQDAIFADGFQN